MVIIYTRDWQVARTLKVCRRNFTDARRSRALGNPGADSNTWRVFHSGNRTTRRRPFVDDTGRPRRKFRWHVHSFIAVLFCHRVHQFFSVVDQVAVASAKIMAEREDQRRPSSPRPGGQARGHGGILSDIYLISGIAIIFVIFTLVSTKLPHYTLPAFPLLALLLARHWHQGELVNRPPFFVRQESRSQLPCLWIAIGISQFRRWWRGFSQHISSFNVSGASLQPNMQFAAVEIRGARVWSGIFAPAFEVFSRR